MHTDIIKVRLMKQRTENPCVGGSIPFPGTFFLTCISFGSPISAAAQYN